jgi:GNAT superfamily N-acetyltransferase
MPRSPAGGESTASVIVRAAGAADFDALVALIRALAEFENLPGPTDDAVARLRADAFGEAPRFEVLLAELPEGPGEVVAYAIFFPTYSTFLARPTLYLEDLFVHPRARRRGVASALLARLAALAQERGCGRLEWMVLDWNAGAQALYDGLGAKRLEQWRLYRVELA